MINGLLKRWINGFFQSKLCKSTFNSKKIQNSWTSSKFGVIFKINNHSDNTSKINFYKIRIYQKIALVYICHQQMFPQNIFWMKTTQSWFLKCKAWVPFKSKNNFKIMKHRCTKVEKFLWVKENRLTDVKKMI